MPEYMAFVYWMYLMPAVMTVAFGVLAVERGVVPDEMMETSKNDQYLDILIQACFPVFNILFGVEFILANLPDGGNR